MSGKDFRKMILERREAKGFIQALLDKEISIFPVKDKLNTNSVKEDEQLPSFSRLPIYRADRCGFLGHRIPIPYNESVDDSGYDLKDSIESKVKTESTVLNVDYPYINICRENLYVDSYDKSTTVPAAVDDKTYLNYYTKDGFEIQIINNPRLVNRVISSEINFEKPYTLARYANIGFSQKDNCWYFINTRLSRFSSRGNNLFKIVPGMKLSDLIDIDQYNYYFDYILKSFNKINVVNQEYYEYYRNKYGTVTYAKEVLKTQTSIYEVHIDHIVFRHRITKNNFVYALRDYETMHEFDINIKLQDKVLETLEDCKEAAILLAKIDAIEKAEHNYQLTYFIDGVYLHNPVLKGIRYEAAEKLVFISKDTNSFKLNIKSKDFKITKKLARKYCLLKNKRIKRDIFEKITVGSALCVSKDALYFQPQLNAITSLKMPTVRVSIDTNN